MKQNIRNILIVTGLLLASIGFYRAATHAYPQLPTTPTQSVQAAVAPEPSLFQLVNNERTSRGLPALVEVAELNASATDKCSDMVNRDYWAHNAPDGTTWQSFISKYDKRPNVTIGENLAEGYNADPQRTTIAWMNSPLHRDNILKPVYTRVGYATCMEGAVLYTVQHFASN